MLIDWFTVAAQIINFMILVVLLQRFLYRPVMRAMSEREAKIAAQLEEAYVLKQAAIEEADSARKQRKELDNYRSALLSEAKEDVEKWRKEAISKAREEIDEARAIWQKNIAAEKQAFVQELRHQIGSQVCAISRRALADLADVQLQYQMIAVFVRRLGELNEAERAMLRESVQRSNHEIILRSAFDMSPESQHTILQTIQESIAADVTVRVNVIPDLLCGIEIVSQDMKLAWTLDNYLVSLEEKLSETLLGKEVEQQHHVHR